MLRISNLSKKFGNKSAVDNVYLDVMQGQFIGVIGRSGAGKSTLLRMINRLAEPSSGSILWDGTDVTRLKGQELNEWRRRSAMIFQQFNLVGRLDVLNNVLVGRIASTPTWRSMLRLWGDDNRTIALAALAQFDMAGYAAQRAEELSGGQQQRVAICRALLQEPDLILADEPVASLDPRNTKLVMDALLRINKHFGITVLCNLHSLDLARTYCDRLVGLSHGKLVFDDVPEALTDSIARELYGIESDDVLTKQSATPHPDLVPEAAVA